jgi:hypothetical protein
MKTPTDQPVNPHTKSALRCALRTWTPKDPAEAKTMLEECMARAAALSAILEEYAWDASRADVSDMRFALEVVDDLLDQGYSMIEWWDVEEAPTTSEEGQA